MKSRLYTRTGDDGTTSLVGGARAPKDSPRLEAYGTVDELNSWLGLLATSPLLDDTLLTLLTDIQHRLFNIGAALATEPESAWQPAPLGRGPVELLEQAVDTIDAGLEPMHCFILPGGCPDSARANIARTVARRAERLIIALARTAPVDADIIAYINRLSDLLFALAREFNRRAGVPDVAWKP